MDSSPVVEGRRSVNVRLGRETASWPTVLNRSDPVPDHESATGALPSRYQAIRTFLQQKPHRVHQAIIFRKVIYILITLFSMISAWAIGTYGWSSIFLFILMGVMFFLWKEQAQRIAFATEQEVEMKIRRKKALQMSETAEWVNMAINRWWMTCNESVFGFMKDYIEPLLQEITPIGIESLELVELDLANQTPFVKNIQIFDPPTSSSETPPTNTKGVIVANIDIGLVAPESKLILKARLGGKRLGYDTLVYVEGIQMSGSVQAIIHFDYEAPFPHLGCISATFTQPPKLWYTVRVLKGLKVTDIPLVKSFIHSFIMSIFQSLLVDPGRLEIDLMSSGPKSIPDPQSSNRARGVMTISFAGNPPERPSQYEDDPRRWFTINLRGQKYQLQLPARRENWKATYSLLVYDLKEDVVILKIKHRRVLYTMTLASHTVSLNSLGLINEDGEELQTSRYMSVGNSEYNISMNIEYTPLPPFSLNYAVPFPINNKVAGVLYIHVHSATGLSSGDVDGLSDPYCVVLANKKKVLTTHYILDTLEPKWERGIEMFVHDFTQISLTFVVYDWDGPLVGDDFLGSCKLNLEVDKPTVLQKQIELEIDGSTMKNEKPLGVITVSAIFREVESVAKSEISTICSNPIADFAIGNTPQGGQGTKATSKQTWKKLKESGGLLPGENFGIIELSVIEGRDLLAMDRNGKSDPYIVVKYGAREVYRTPYIPKTLDPKWNCHCTLSAPPSSSPIVIECWDNNQFSNSDFMGSIAFTTPEDLLVFESGPKWCRLEHISKGEILIELRRINPVPTDSLSSEDISQFGEATKLTNGNASPPKDKQSLNSSNEGKEQDDSGVPQIALENPSPTRSLSPSFTTTALEMGPKTHIRGLLLGRRSTITPRTSGYRNSYTPSVGSGDSSISSHSMTIGSVDEFQRNKHRRDTAPVHLSSARRGLVLENSLVQQFFHGVAGEIIEAEGLKGKLDHLELYVKVRLNSHPTHLRPQKFDRGSVIHRTRRLKGSSSLSYKENFTIKESPIPVDSLLTIDLKSGPHVTLGTHVITLDKIFEGNFEATKWLDLGNDMRVMVKLTRRLPHARSADFNIQSKKL